MERRDAVVHIRLSSSEIDAVREAADQAALTVSTYCRRRILAHAVVSRVDAQLTRELRRQGGLVKQALANGIINSVDAKRALSEIVLAIQKLSKGET
jgi:hypothetical protein